MHSLFKFLIQIYRQQSASERALLYISLALTGTAASLEIKVLGLVGTLFADIGNSVVNTNSAILLVIFSILNAVVRVLQIRISHGYVYGIGHLLSCSALENSFNADYIDLKKSHSSILLKRFEIINVIINSVLTPFVIFLSSSLLAVAIAVSLFMTDPTLAFVGLSGLATFYAVAVLVSRKALLHNAATLSRTQGERLFLVREAITGFRELKIGGQIEKYGSHFSKVDRLLRAAQVRNLVIGSAPRFILEAMVFVVLAILVLWPQPTGGDIGAPLIGVLATFALGVQRLLPHAQSIYSSISSVVGHYDLITELATPLFNVSTQRQREYSTYFLPITSTIGEIRLRRISYTYPDSNTPVFRNLNLTIKRGTKVALVGPSGTGKSTFLELISGLLIPSEGTIEVNDVSLSDVDISLWQSQLAYVPQSPFVLSDTLRENLSLGALGHTLSDQRLVDALKAVGLDDWFQHLPEGLEYHVGENGINLSGGQKQRLAIARALVGDRTILILDEVTSNLDAENEANVLDLILSLPKQYTVICSLHKVKVLDQFDEVFNFAALIA